MKQIEKKIIKEALIDLKIAYSGHDISDAVIVDPDKDIIRFMKIALEGKGVFYFPSSTTVYGGVIRNSSVSSPPPISPHFVRDQIMLSGIDTDGNAALFAYSAHNNRRPEYVGLELSLQSALITCNAQTKVQVGNKIEQRDDVDLHFMIYEENLTGATAQEQMAEWYKWRVVEHSGIDKAKNQDKPKSSYSYTKYLCMNYDSRVPLLFLPHEDTLVYNEFHNDDNVKKHIEHQLTKFMR